MSRLPRRERSRSPARRAPAVEDEDNDPEDDYYSYGAEDDNLLGRAFFKTCVRILKREVRDGWLQYKFKLGQGRKSLPGGSAPKIFLSVPNKAFRELEIAVVPHPWGAVGGAMDLRGFASG